ncbi:arsenate reductase ArsC [Oceanivirga miroungae]|uniref:Glutaredoxin arsenate reductase n=1 Tax=Oceanivirga miroungae TaxID=1130046 RepID=A0A6I8MDT8_9FUSO|nr:arsenate reductase ArsC [Oceanivirga miroungae]VWL85603.1 Glutaredoxin arsenate reductase [Oceanivirga miroungae]
MKKKVVFLCVHNSCRSQIAEALAKKYGKDILEVYSAGTMLKDKINEDAVRLMKKIHDIDMQVSQKPKLIEDIPKVDYVITMGCNVVCPSFSYKVEKFDWGLDDPSGKSDDEFIKIINTIEVKVLDLIKRVR